MNWTVPRSDTDGWERSEEEAAQDLAAAGDNDLGEDESEDSGQSLRTSAAEDKHEKPSHDTSDLAAAAAQPSAISSPAGRQPWRAIRTTWQHDHPSFKTDYNAQSVAERVEVADHIIVHVEAQERDATAAREKEDEERRRPFAVGIALCLAFLILMFAVFIPARYYTNTHTQASVPTVCVTSNSEGILDWAMQLQLAESAPGRSVTLRRLATVLSEDTHLSKQDEDALKSEVHWAAKFMPWYQPPCDQVLVIVRASQLASGRSPLYKYTAQASTKKFLDHPNATLAVVNGTCEDMVGAIADRRAGSIVDCKRSRKRTFGDFKAAMAPPQLVPATMNVKDVPSMSSGVEYFRLLFTYEIYEDPIIPHSEIYEDPNITHSDALTSWVEKLFQGVIFMIHQFQGMIHQLLSSSSLLPDDLPFFLCCACVCALCSVRREVPQQEDPEVIRKREISEKRRASLALARSKPREAKGRKGL